MILGSADFLGVNYYTARMVKLREKPSGRSPSLERDSMIDLYVKPTWKQAKSSWIYSVPEGISGLLK